RLSQASRLWLRQRCSDREVIARSPNMSFYTDWFIAHDSEAEAIAAISSDEETTFDDWPNLQMKGVGDTELAALWALVQGDREAADDVCGDRLLEWYDEDGGMVYVSRVVPEFITARAAVQLADMKVLAVRWAQAEGLAGWEQSDVASLLGEIVEFARRA